MDTLTEALEVLRQVAALKRYDANAGRTNAGRHYTLNIPAPLMARIDALAVEAVGREYSLDLSPEKLRICERRAKARAFLKALDEFPPTSAEPTLDDASIVRLALKAGFDPHCAFGLSSRLEGEASALDEALYVAEYPVGRMLAAFAAEVAKAAVAGRRSTAPVPPSPET
jgi:hypothetical protein